MTSHESDSVQLSANFILWYFLPQPNDFEPWNQLTLSSNELRSRCNFLSVTDYTKCPGNCPGNCPGTLPMGKFVNRSLFWVFRIVTRSFNIPIHQWNAKFDFSRAATNGAKDWNCWLWQNRFDGAIFWLLENEKMKSKFRVSVRVRVK